MRISAARSVWLLLLSLRLVICEDAEAAAEANQFSVCEDSPVVVNYLQVLCSSPGQYYYGSSKYRNSATCMAGDKARYQIKFYIEEDLGEGAYPFLTVKVAGYGTVEAVSLYEDVPLCGITDLFSEDGAACPEPGQYYVEDAFQWGYQSDSYKYSFRPVVEVGVASYEGAKYYDLGGANTNNCQSDISSGWSAGVKRSVSNTVHTFIVTLGILFLGTVLFFSASWFLNRHFDFSSSGSRSAGEVDKKALGASTTTQPSDKTEPLNISALESAIGQDDFIDEEDIKRIAMMGRERDLIDA